MKKIIPLLFIILTCPSCFKSPLYKPCDAITPTFEQKGDIDVQGSSNLFDGIQGSLGYSATNHFGVFIGGVNNHQTDSTNNTANVSRYAFSAAGYYTQIAKTTNNKGSSTYFFGIYGGLGTGYYRTKGERSEPPTFLNFDDDDVEYGRFHQRGSYNNYFTQINFSIKDDYEEFSLPFWSILTAKLQYMDFYNYDNFIKDYRAAKTATDAFFLELGFGMEFCAIDQFKVSVHYTHNTLLGNEELNYDYKKDRLNVGISYNVSVFGKNKKVPE